jgi:pimeloyl-ACP methyl ester carboxylesterase
MLACTSSTSLTDVCAVPDPRKPESCLAPSFGGVGCSSNWKSSDMDLYRDAISQPGAIYAMLEYYRNLWLSIQQMEHYGKIDGDIPILVLWGLNDKTFPREQYAQGWEDWIEPKDNGNDITVSYLDCGHFTPEEKPEEVNRQLLNFFQKMPLEPECRGEISEAY